MIAHYLKFADEAEAIANLSQYRGVDEFNYPVWIDASHHHALDAVGTIYHIVNDVPVAQPGFHVNLRCDNFPAALAAFEITPASPYRVFA